MTGVQTCALPIYAELDTHGWRWRPGVGQADDGSWREDLVLVLDIGEEDAVALGRRWQQVAVVVGARGGTVRLLACFAAGPGHPET